MKSKNITIGDIVEVRLPTGYKSVGAVIKRLLNSMYEVNISGYGITICSPYQITKIIKSRRGTEKPFKPTNGQVIEAYYTNINDWIKVTYIGMWNNIYVCRDHKTHNFMSFLKVREIKKEVKLVPDGIISFRGKSKGILNGKNVLYYSHKCDELMYAESEKPIPKKYTYEKCDLKDLKKGDIIFLKNTTMYSEQEISKWEKEKCEYLIFDHYSGDSMECYCLVLTPTNKILTWNIDLYENKNVEIMKIVEIK